MKDRILEILTKTNITIEEMENIQTYLEELEDDRKLLYALQAAGVDSWSWYGEAMKIYHEEEEEDE